MNFINFQKHDPTTVDKQHVKNKNKICLIISVTIIGFQNPTIQLIFY